MNKKRKILVCPLDWGLGHASRDIHIIRALIENDFEVFVAGSPKILKYLGNEIPDVKCVDLEGFKVKYSKRKSQIFKMLTLIPRIFFWTIKEHFKLKQLVKKHNFNIVISDNRFGLWNKNVKSIFITHQLRVIFPSGLRIFEFIYRLLVRFIINKYDECWIPDLKEEKNLAGDLSHPKRKLKNGKYIGLLSRFAIFNHYQAPETLFDIVFVLSGPEPQRSLLEEIIYFQIQESNLRIAIVRGTYENSVLDYSIPKFDLLQTNELNKLIDQSEIVVCRSGYSSVMDLISKNKKAILIPTPGQTEQEYLATYLTEKDYFTSYTQDKFKLSRIVVSKIKQPNFREKNNENLLQKAIKELE
ncbi:MAG: hypothetical protein JEY96_12525 [Bacteroidales bacterium]|nr:hypothetical protein [Bacteroidales bacterium]